MRAERVILTLPKGRCGQIACAAHDTCGRPARARSRGGCPMHRDRNGLPAPRPWHMACTTGGTPHRQRPRSGRAPAHTSEGPMKRQWILAAALLIATQAQPLHAETQTWFGFQVGISGGSAPPPVFRSEPQVVYVNDVYVVDDDRCDDDVFRADNLWWRMRAGR